MNQIQIKGKKKKQRITFLVGAVEEQELEGGNESNVF